MRGLNEYYPLNSHFLLFVSLAQIRDRRPLRKRETAEDFYYRRGAQCAPISLPLRSAGFRTATHIGCSTQARHKLNCPKGKRGSPGGYTCRATRFSIFNSQFAEFPPQTVPEHLLYLKENHSTETILYADSQTASHKPNRAAAVLDTLRSISNTAA